MPDIFLSYNREDHACARRFAEAFQAEGFDVWWDAALRSGEAYDKVTEKALHDARAVVVLWSRCSVESRWVRAEATEADRSQKLVPAMIESCKRPIMFELVQTAELSHWKGNRADPVWRAYVEDVRGFVSGAAQPARTSRPVAGQSRGSLRRWRNPILILLSVLGLAGAAALWWHPANSVSPDAPLRVAAFEAQGGSEAAVFAQVLKDSIVDVIGKAGFQTTAEGSAGDDQDGLRLSGSVVQKDDALNVFTQIVDVASGVTIWSDRFTGVTSDTDHLATEVAVASTDPLAAIRDLYLQEGISLGPEHLALQVKGAVIVVSPRKFQEGMASRSFEEAVARAPDVAYGHAMLALTLVQDAARAPPDQRDALFERARSEAKTAIGIDPPASGAAYDARYLMSVYLEPGNIIGQEDLLLEGLRNAPEFPYRPMRYCQFLLGVGRIEDAWPYCQRARALRPLGAPIEWRFADALKMRGEQALAQQAAAQAARYHPDNTSVRTARFDIFAFGDSFGQAAPLVADMLNQGEGFGSREIDALKLYLEARDGQSRAQIGQASAALLSAATDGKLRTDLAVKALASLGSVDQAFALLQRITRTLPPLLDQVQANPGTEFLFAPETAPLRADPRFWQFAARQGLVGYWTQRDKWPDFCGRQMTLEDCRSAARKALQQLE